MKAIEVKELIDYIQVELNRWGDAFDCYQLLKDIEDEDIPTIEPEPHWIPVTERLPEDDTLMLVNYIDHRPDAGDIWIGWHEMENVWYIDGEEHSEERGNEVVAWMSLPEPYRREQDGH